MSPMIVTLIGDDGNQVGTRLAALPVRDFELPAGARIQIEEYFPNRGRHICVALERRNNEDSTHHGELEGSGTLVNAATTNGELGNIYLKIVAHNMDVAYELLDDAYRELGIVPEAALAEQKFWRELHTHQDYLTKVHQMADEFSQMGKPNNWRERFRDVVTRWRSRQVRRDNEFVDYLVQEVGLLEVGIDELMRKGRREGYIQPNDPHFSATPAGGNYPGPTGAMVLGAIQETTEDAIGERMMEPVEPYGDGGIENMQFQTAQARRRITEGQHRFLSLPLSEVDPLDHVVRVTLGQAGLNDIGDLRELTETRFREILATRNIGCTIVDRQIADVTAFFKEHDFDWPKAESDPRSEEERKEDPAEPYGDDAIDQIFTSSRVLEALHRNRIHAARQFHNLPEQMFHKILIDAGEFDTLFRHTQTEIAKDWFAAHPEYGPWPEKGSADTVLKGFMSQEITDLGLNSYEYDVLRDAGFRTVGDVYCAGRSRLRELLPPSDMQISDPNDPVYLIDQYFQQNQWVGYAPWPVEEGHGFYSLEEEFGTLSPLPAHATSAYTYGEDIDDSNVRNTELDDFMEKDVKVIGLTTKTTRALKMGCLPTVATVYAATASKIQEVLSASGIEQGTITAEINKLKEFFQNHRDIGYAPWPVEEGRPAFRRAQQ